MPGNRGQGRRNQQDTTPGRHEMQNSSRGSRTPQATTNQQTPGSSRGRGRGRRGGGPGRGSDTTPFAANRTPSGTGRSPWSAGRGSGTRGCPGYHAATDAATDGAFSYTRGSAAVSPEDHVLLLVGKDAKMPTVWELRIHPSQRFSTAWLAAVDRWTQNMISGSSADHHQQQAAAAPPPPPPRGTAAVAEASSSAAAGARAPRPAEPPEMNNDDYDSSESDSNADSDGQDLASNLDAAATAAVGDDEINADSDSSDNGVYDMLSYLKKMTISNGSAAAAAPGSSSAAAEPDLDAVSCAATAGSSIAGRRAWRRGARSAAVGGDSAAELAEGDESDSAGSWETDSQAAEGDYADQEQQQQEEEEEGETAEEGLPNLFQQRQELEPTAAAAAGGSGDLGSSCDGDREHFSADSDSNDSAYDAAVTAAEEQDLLCEPGPKLQQQSVSSSSGDAGTSGPADDASTLNGAGRERRVRRGERKREKWQQQLLVSLRLERQGLTDREAQQLANWYTSSPSAQHLPLCKLWLFDNSLGDAAAAALAPLIGPHTSELHLSHNQIGVEGAKALLAAVPLQRAKGLKPLWFRVEWNQVDQGELRRFIQQDCAARGLVVDIAEEVPVSERPNRTDSKGRELNLSWNKPWQEVHVQMPWLSCQRAPPAEAAVLQAAKAVWSRRGQLNGAAAAAAGPAEAAVDSSRASRSIGSAAADQRTASAPQQQHQQVSRPFSGGSRYGGVVAAAAALDSREQVTLPLVQTPPPPPPRSAAAAPAVVSSSSVLNGAADTSAAAAAAPAPPAVKYQDGPLMLFLDTSALLAMLGCGGSMTSNTCLTMKLLQALAGSGRFGRGLPVEQQTFIVLADTVLKQLDSFKSGEAGVAGPVRRFLDKGLDEVGPKGLDFLTVLAAHEGEGLVVDRQAAVAGSRSPSFNGTTGQRSDLSIIEVGLFFRTELLAAATAALAEAGLGDEQLGLEAQPVVLVTNDNGQLQLAKAHGLPAFKLAGASEFEAQITSIIRSGGDLSSSTLRSLMAPSATAGLGAVAGRSLQDDYDGSISCLRGLLEAYQDLSGLLGRVSVLVAGSLPGEEAAVLTDLQQLLQDHQHMQLFPEIGDSHGTGISDAAIVASRAGSAVSVLDASLANISALERSLVNWEDRAARHHTPSRVLKWAGSGRGKMSSIGL